MATTMTTRNKRVDFAIPKDAERSRCRYCLATIYWATEVYRGPLHGASAIKVAGVVRMESHVGHCPQRSRALGAAKSQCCPGRGCKERIEVGDRTPILCSVCWGLLPDSIRSWVSRESRRSPRTPAYGVAMDHARRIVGQLRDRRYPRPAPSLFPGAEYG